MLFVVKWGILAFVLLFMGRILPGMEVTNLFTALFATLVIELINMALYPTFILLKYPFNNLSCLLITFLINMVSFFFMALILPGFNLDGFLRSLMNSALFSVISVFINK